MENSPVIQPDGEIIRVVNRSGNIHHLHRLRMKKRVLLFRRRSTRRGSHNSNARSRRWSYEYPHGEAIEQQLKWAPPFHTGFKCLTPSLLGVVAVKYQAKSEDPLKTRPLQTWSFLAAIFIYSLILLVLKQMKNHHNKYFEMSIRISVVSGVLSSFSLLSLLLPHFPGLLLLYTSWALSAVIAIWPILQRTYNWLLRGIKTIWLTGSNSEPPVLPL